MKHLHCLVVGLLLAGCIAQPAVEVESFPVMAGNLITATSGVVKVVTLVPMRTRTPTLPATRSPMLGSPTPTPTPAILGFISGAVPKPVGDVLPELPSREYSLYFTSGGSPQVWKAGSDTIEPYGGELPPPVECTSLNGFCPSPTARFDLTNLPGANGITATGVIDYSTGQSRIIAGAENFPRAYNTFAWTADEGILLFAHAWRNAGLFRIDPVSGDRSALLELEGCGFGVESCDPLYAAMGITDPVALPGGRIGFSVQTANGAGRLPPGIYTRDATGQFYQMAPLPLIEKECLSEDAMFLYGRVYWSPDGSAYVYRGPLHGEKPCPAPYVLISSMLTGATAEDVSSIIGTAADFRWGK